MFYSPLRYPGGKGKLSGYIKLLMSENGIVDGTYIEPFAGGAGVALNLLLDGTVSKVKINDKNRAIYAFWDALLNETDTFCDLIRNTPVTIEEWKRQRIIYLSEESYGVSLGFATFFLNRTNISGILTGGVIGGAAQNGKWKIDARYNKENLIKRIELIANKRKCVEVYNDDIFVFIEKTLQKEHGNSFIYFDPPYFLQGSRLYENHFKEDDHVRLAKCIHKNIRCKWIVTYDDVPQIGEIYNSNRKKSFALNYSASRKYMGNEIIIYSDDVIIPSRRRTEKEKVKLLFK